MSATTFYNSTNLVGIGTLNAASVSTTLANVIQANIQSMNVSGDSNLSGNLITGNIIMASNLSTNSGQGNVYISANLVVNGNIFSIGGSVGSGSGTSQGVTYVLPSSYSLGTAFATGSAGPGIAGFHINMSLFGAQAIAAVSSFSASSGMLKFASAGLYSVQCVLVGDQPATKVGIGSTSSASFPPSVTATSGYVYVYNYPLNSSPTTLVTIPLTIQDTSKWYYLDAYFSTVSGSPSVLLQTAPPSGSASGSNYGTYVQVGPFGNYLTSATGVASGLLMNCYGTTTLSSPVTSNTFRLAMTTANGWTVNGVSTSLAVTPGGNIQVNQAGIYEVSMCLNPSVTPMMFGIGSLSTDAAPVAQGPYLYQYAPMYTQDPTTVVSLPVNITDTSKYYYLDVIFPGSQATMALSNVSTFVSIKPIGSYVSPSTNPWLQQGTSVYYNSGPVGLGVVPTALTETLTVSGNTSFISNVTVTSDVSGASYVNAKRVPAGSLSVANYVTGSVPLTTTTSPYGPCLTLPGTVGSYYSAANAAYDTNWRTSGFCLEMWINYASFANATNGGTAQSSPLTWSHGPGGGTYDWGFGATNVGGLCLFLGGPSVANTAASVITTGSWNHIMVQGNGSNIYMAVNGTFQALNATYSPAGGNNTVAPTQPSVLAITSLNPIYVGSAVTLSPPNFSVAKARLTFGTAGSPSLGNVYSSGNFTANPNFAPVPAGATVAWSLDSQYPLPTYPSIQDVTQLPLQSSSYGARPTPIGGVTSNVLGPYTGTQLNSIRFDGTGYIDYGAGAASVMNSNIWAGPWTIEGWVYTSTTSVQQAIISRGINLSYADWSFYLNGGGGATQGLYLGYNFIGGGSYVGGGAIPTNTWTHVVAQFDGTNANVYAAGSLIQSVSISSGKVYVPSASTFIGCITPSQTTQFMVGNLADVRVSNVARYTGSSYTVPSAPFASNDANTLLLLKSLAGQQGTTLEVQGRGLNAVSLGATRSVQSYPPAPMSSYLLDTTGNTAVTYGQGKYVASASSEYTGQLPTNYPAWTVFDKTTSWTGTPVTYPFWSSNTFYSTSSGVYLGSITTVDTIGNSYIGDWLQLQLPVSVLLTNYNIWVRSDYVYQAPVKFWILGSRDGTNWTLADSRAGTTWASPWNQTFVASVTQAYNFYRLVINTTTNAVGSGGNTPASILELIFNGTEESLCVTADSKIGIGLANPQRALEVAGDLVVSGTISGGAGLGAFRNRIINGDMRIAQRGTSNVVGTTGQGNYMIDRFYASIYPSGTLILTQTRQTLVASDTPYQLGIKYSLRVASANGGTIGVNAYVTQPIEGQNGTIDLNWGTSFGAPVTLSFWVRTNAVSGTVFAGSITNSGYNSSYNFQYTATSTSGLWQYITFTLPPPPNGTTWTIDNTAGIILNLWAHQISPGGNGLTSSPFTWVSGNYQGTFAAAATPWWQTAGNYIEWTGVQLEKGGVSTPYEFRPYATELALCQRYYQQFNCTSSGGSGQTFGTGLVSTATSVYTMTPLIVPMRANSALSSNSAPNTFIIGTGASAFTPTSMSLAQASTNQVYLNWVVAAATASQPAVVQANSTTAAFLGFNAEL